MRAQLSRELDVPRFLELPDQFGRLQHGFPEGKRVERVCANVAIVLLAAAKQRWAAGNVQNRVALNRGRAGRPLRFKLLARHRREAGHSPDRYSKGAAMTAGVGDLAAYHIRERTGR